MASYATATAALYAGTALTYRRSAWSSDAQKFLGLGFDKYLFLNQTNSDGIQIKQSFCEFTSLLTATDTSASDWVTP